MATPMASLGSETTRGPARDEKSTATRDLT